MEPTFFIACILPGLVVATIGLLFRRYPPRDINRTYGYRTTASMRNKDTWKEANIYSAPWMITAGLVSAIAGAAGAAFFEKIPAVLLAAGVLIAGLFIAICLTEIHLKKVFDSEGKRKKLNA